jgi:16S rRNA C967 or C1407 C5-methylase (RsmB/RsmF family)
MKNKLNKIFLEKLNTIYSKSELEIIEKGFNVKNPTTFRINNLKNDYDVLKNFE